MNQLLGGNECERTHTLTTTTTTSKNSQKEANNQTRNQNSVLCPPKVPSLQIDTIPTKNRRELVEKWVSELMTNF